MCAWPCIRPYPRKAFRGVEFGPLVSAPAYGKGREVIGETGVAREVDGGQGEGGVHERSQE